MSPRREANRLSVPSSRPASTTIYDPDVTTRGWEIYRDPSEESDSIVSADRQQCRGNDPATRSPRRSARTSDHPVTPHSDSPAEAQSQSATTTPHNHNHEHEHLRHQGSSEASSPSLGGHIISAPDESSRKTAERVLRTLKQILAEEQERQETFGAGENNGAVDVRANVTGAATDDELIERLEVRYQQLTLREEGKYRRGAGERGRRPRKRRGHGEMEVEGPRLGHGLEEYQGQSNIQGGFHGTTEGQILGRIEPDARIDASNVNVPAELSDSTAASISMATSTSVQDSLPTSIQIIGPASASAVKSGVGTGTGLSFAERMRSHEREREPERTRARKKARLAGPGGGSGHGGDGNGDLITLNELSPAHPLLQSHRETVAGNAGEETGAEAYVGADAQFGGGDTADDAAATAPSGDVFMHDLTRAEPDQMA